MSDVSVRWSAVAVERVEAGPLTKPAPPRCFDDVSIDGLPIIVFVSAAGRLANVHEASLVERKRIALRTGVLIVYAVLFRPPIPGSVP
jgi:hypothetical protein